MLEALANVVLVAAKKLREAPVASGSELHEKFASKSYELQYGTFSGSFDGGLAAMVGAPHPDVLRYMRIEHTGSVDSRKAFMTSNFALLVRPDSPIRTRTSKLLCDCPHA
eukprot:1124497-Prymnesium_polylepis.1